MEDTKKTRFRREIGEKDSSACGLRWCFDN